MNLDVEVFVIWTRVLVNDSADAARWMAALSLDPRVVVFDDQTALAGRALAGLVGMPAMQTVKHHWQKSDAELAAIFGQKFLTGPPTLFDTALVFDGAARFNEARPPTPIGWVSQLNPAAFEGVTPKHYFVQEGFGSEIERIVRESRKEAASDSKR